jgi:6-phosphogluconolactonase
MEAAVRKGVKERVQVLPDLEAISWRAADLFVSLSRKSIHSKKRFAVALSGGSTPKRLYALLGSDLYRDQVDWQSIHFFWADERCVPKEHEESNFKMAFEALLSKVPVPAPNLHRIKGEEGPEKGAKDYEEELRDFFGRAGVPVFDLMILGMGEDGHTASLFPGSPSLFETEGLAVPVPMEKSRADRITLTLPVLNNALQILFLVAGPSKADVLGEIFAENKREQYPAGRIHPVHGNLQWFIDQEASGRLERIKSKS